MIKNLDKLEAKLKAIASITPEKGLRRAALIVERDAKEFVPVDTGLLRASITTEVSGKTATVGTSIEYAPNVELGIGQRRQPYLTPALLFNKDRINNEIRKDVEEQLERLAK